MKIVFIVNPVAGGFDVSETVDRLLPKAAAAAGVLEYTVVRTEYPGHARELAQQYGESGEAVRLYAVGGDGTFNEVISGAYPYKNAAVGCIPYGSGNDFLRNFGIREEFQDLADQLAGVEMDIDLIQTGYGVCATICSAGLDAEIAYQIPKFRRLPFCKGEMAYRLSIIKQLLGPLGRKLSITLDGYTQTEECLLTAVCNGGYYGGGFYAAPECSMDDGLLDVMIVRKMPLLRIAKVLPMYQKGQHLRGGQIVPELSDVVEFHRCRSVEIRSADENAKPVVVNVDGECREAAGIAAHVLPLGGRIVLPAAVYARQKQKQMQ